MKFIAHIFLVSHGWGKQMRDGLLQGKRQMTEEVQGETFRKQDRELLQKSETNQEKR